MKYKYLAERLEEATANVEAVEEEVSILFNTLDVWDDIDDWEFHAETGALCIYLRHNQEPEFNSKVRAGLRAAGFSTIYFPDWGPLATIDLRNWE